jgi:hypothetical protein
MTLRSSKWFSRAAIAVTVGALPLLGVSAAVHVINGDAADTYTNVKGMRISWGGALVFVAAMVVALGAAFFARWWQNRTVRTGGSSAVGKELRSNTSLERTRDR